LAKDNPPTASDAVPAMTRDERLEGIMGEDGITNCGNAQNCVKVCPMNIPLTKAIY
jgi:succinate dehydrogenase / fumarate reductase, iron-sulfur subunit